MSIRWKLAFPLALFCIVLSSCGSHDRPPAQAEDACALDQASQNLIADWLTYLVECEKMYGDLEWAFSYLDSFFQNHSWDNLQIARAAVAAAESAAIPLEAPKTQTTFEDYDFLLHSGADISGVQNAISSFQLKKDSVLRSYHSLQLHLNSPRLLFFDSILTNFEKMAHIDQKVNDVNIRLAAAVTDSMLLCLNNDEAEAEFLGSIAESCPRINARRENNPQDLKGLYHLINDLASEHLELENSRYALNGQIRASSQRLMESMEHVIEGDDLNSMISTMVTEAVEFVDFPIALPYPQGEDRSTILSYFWSQEDGSVRQVEPGVFLDTPPDQYYLEWSDVPQEEYEAYLKYLSVFGIPASFTKEEDGVYYAYYNLSYDSLTSSFLLMWQNNAMGLYSLDGSVCLAPVWYIYHTFNFTF